MTTYQIDVYTGDRAKAGTDANVFINLFGKAGSTGKRALKDSKNTRNKFEKGQMDTFELEVADLDELTKCVVNHDGKGAGEIKRRLGWRGRGYKRDW